jgi:hypothetical protein
VIYHHALSIGHTFLKEGATIRVAHFFLRSKLVEMFRRIVSGFKRVFQNAETKLPSTNVGAHNHQEILGKIDRFEEMSKANEIYKNAMKELSQDNTVRANLKDPKILAGLLTKNVKELTVTELEQLAEGCFDGIGVPVDKAKAFSYWEMAAEKGSFGGKFSVAQCLKEGIGAEKNPERAFQLLTEIVNSTNYAPAQVTIIREAFGLFFIIKSFLVFTCNVI